MKTTLPVFTITVSFICCFWLFDTGLAVLLNTQDNQSFFNIMLNKLSPPQLYTPSIFSLGYFLVALVISYYLRRTLTAPYRFFIEESYDWLWEVDDKGVFTYSNAQVKTILGYQPNELIGNSLFKFLSPEEAQRLKTLYQAHQPFNTLETTYQHKDGRSIVLRRNASPIFNRRGRFLGYQGIDRDITSSRWTEQMLRRRSYELEERIKELECLYRLSALFEHANLSLEAILNHILVIIPQAWQYPDLACVRIRLFEQVFLSEQFQETQWQLNAPLTVKTQEVGHLELFYRQKRSAGPVFLTEEYYLINEISVRLSHFIENKQAEMALKHSAAQYRNLVEMIPHGVYELDHQYRIILCNPTGAQMLGYQVTELLGRSFIKCCCHKPKQLALSFTQHLTTRRCLTQFVHKSGPIIDVQIDWNDKFNSAHERIGLIVVMTDISEYKQAQRALEKSEEKYRNLVEHLNDWVWEVDEYSCFTYSSCLVQQLFGYTPEELIGTSAFNLLIADTGWPVAKLFKVSRRYRKPFVDMETKVRHKNGHPLFLSTSAMPIFDAEGQFRGYRGVSRNITTRKQMEKTLSTTNRALRIRNHCNEAIIHNTYEAQLLTQICDIFINIAHYQFVWIGFINELQTDIQPIAQQGALQEYSLTWFQPWMKRALRSYCPTLTTQNPDEAVIALPLLAHDQIFGIICLVNHPSQLEEPTEIRLLSQLANDLAYGIMALRAARERQQAEEALRESEQQFALFMQHLPVAAFIKDTQSRFVYINQYMQTHFQAHHWLGEAITTLFPPALAKTIMADDQSAFDKGFQQTVQTFNDIEGNQHIYQTYKFVIQRLHKPSLLGGFILDITEQKQAEIVLKTYSQLLEQQVAQRTQTLIENNALLNATLEATADGILVVAEPHQVLLYNQNFISMWHIPEKLLATQNYPKRLFFVARQLKVPQQFLSRLRQIHQQPQQEHYECLTFKDGRIYECYIRPYRLHQQTLG
ncbi:MAG: PAS domain S-box protein, partial [Pseudomonadota bacterium]|nr:PAS domain S-box protein [Pseudomonadota bacterium]